MKLMGPIFRILMNSYKYGSNDSSSMYGFLLGIHYDCIFFAQGVNDQFYNQEIMKYRSELAATVLTPLSIGAWILLYSLTSPMNSNTGFLFYYPLYSKFEYQALYTTGTWQWVYMIVWVFKEHSNQKFNEAFYDLMVGSSMWAYITHYVFIVLSANYIVRTMNLTYIPALLSNILFSEVMVLITYAMICKIKSLMPKKEKSENKKVTELKIDKFDPEV